MQSGCDRGSLVKKLFPLLITLLYRPRTIKSLGGRPCPVLSYIRHCSHPSLLFAISCSSPSSPILFMNPNWLPVIPRATDRHAFPSSSSVFACITLLKIQLIPSRILCCICISCALFV